MNKIWSLYKDIIWLFQDCWYVHFCNAEYMKVVRQYRMQIHVSRRHYYWRIIVLATSKIYVRSVIAATQRLTSIHRVRGQKVSGRTPVDPWPQKLSNSWSWIHALQTKSHRWQHWRESSPGDMLHLTTERIFKVGASLNNYFLFNT